MVSGTSRLHLKYYIAEKGRSHFLLKRVITRKEKEENKKQLRAKEALLMSVPAVRKEIEELQIEVASCMKEIDQAKHEI